MTKYSTISLSFAQGVYDRNYKRQHGNVPDSDISVLVIKKIAILLNSHIDFTIRSARI